MGDIDYIILLRLVVAVFFGSVIGFERSLARHDAGLRTHILVCLGAASVMVLSECLQKEYGGDIMRMGAQVMSGIGFLGVGCMMVSGNRVRGVTTAAGIWTTACVGLVVGSGYYIIAATIVALMTFAMFGLKSFAKKIREKSQTYILRIIVTNRECIKEILEEFNQQKIEVLDAKYHSAPNNEVEAMLELSVPINLTIGSVISQVSGNGSVNHVQHLNYFY